jgi:uncharacterized membrane protein YphA (DoxX/SURF4 family)
MNDSMAQPGPGLFRTDAPGWKSKLSWGSAVVLCAVFLLSGLWKITDVQGAAVRMVQAKVPQSLGLAAALFIGIVETVGAVMILVPRLRRWGVLVLAGLLVAFLGYFAIHYNALRGAECSCFPWLKRVVGPGFFVGDGLLLLLALFAGLESRPPKGVRTVALIAAAVTVFAGVSYGVGEARHTGTRAPESVLVEGRPYSLAHGKVFLFYFDPSCMHCFESAQKMSKLHWGDTSVVGVPISQGQFAAQFIQDTGFRMAITTDRNKLKEVFPYAAVPAGVVLESARLMLARNAIGSMSSVTDVNTRRSVALMPKSILGSNRVSARAPATPIRIPTTAKVIACPTMRILRLRWAGGQGKADAEFL